jgi:hypothetical protein
VVVGVVGVAAAVAGKEEEEVEVFFGLEISWGAAFSSFFTARETHVFMPSEAPNATDDSGST